MIVITMEQPFENPPLRTLDVIEELKQLQTRSIVNEDLLAWKLNVSPVDIHMALERLIGSRVLVSRDSHGETVFRVAGPVSKEASDDDTARNVVPLESPPALLGLHEEPDRKWMKNPSRNRPKGKKPPLP